MRGCWLVRAAWSALLVAGGCGGETSSLPERPSEARRWIAVETGDGLSAVTLDRLLAPQATRLTAPGELFSAVELSPDGQQLAYVSGDHDGPTEIRLSGPMGPARSLFRPRGLSWNP